MADQIARHSGLPLPVEVTYDDYSLDIVENQVLARRDRSASAAPWRTTGAASSPSPDPAGLRRRCTLWRDRHPPSMRLGPRQPGTGLPSPFADWY